MNKEYRYIRKNTSVLRTVLVATMLLAGLVVEAQPTIRGSVYGGGALANVGGDTKVILLGGTINNDVYGGGKGRLDGTTDENGNDLPAVAATVGATTVYLNGMEAADYVPATYSNLGLAQADDADPYTVANNKKGCIVKGSIFGCNNLNGSPTGNATVHVYKTQNEEAGQIANPAEGGGTAKVKGRYDVTAVYGGGNLAPYMAETGSTNVIIDGCDLTSIETVYGGGNAASTPATSITVYGTYEINELFGGGNGLTALPDGRPNPGANVGYKNYTIYEEVDGQTVAKDDPNYDTKDKRTESDIVYGTGAANVNIYGGNVHAVFGGSNTKGNVRISAVTLLDDQESCDFFNIDEAYGGGKSAPMDAEAKLLMSCIPGLKNAYGGAEAADIQGDVTLNITNGNFERVFGGNNMSGTIGGKITVNIEETGCKPIVIGQVYGGGNLAAYDGSPTINIKSFTSIGEIYGGGYGSTATVNGDTYVNINEVVLSKDDTGQSTDFSKQAFAEKTINYDDGSSVTVYRRDADENGAMGVIGNVYGGGNEAPVQGDTHVNVGTVSEVEIVTLPKDVQGNYQKHPVKGADIRGNVYGGGNKAEVSGSTNVIIGK